MQVARVAAIITALLLTGGCVQIVKKQIRSEAIAQCELQGKEFFELDIISKGGMFGTVAVSGQCMGPDDDGYEEAVAARDAREAAAAAPK